MSELIERSEKLSSALYLITSFFDDKEPIKWKLRTLASDLISFGVIIKDNLSGEREVIILKMRKVIMEIMSLISVARNVGLISDINHSLLHQEFSKYLNLLSFPQGLSEENGCFKLSPDFFGAEINKVSEYGKTERILLKDRKKDEQIYQSKPVVPTQHQSIDKGHLALVNTRGLKEFGAVSVKKNSRQSVIIAILKRKKEVTIKDVTPLISGCSEKTVQRELLSMVQSGVLKKEGEKRWSRYSLARP